jgi:hypothetical protein
LVSRTVADSALLRIPLLFTFPPDGLAERVL